ncbi:MAG: tRNA dihydrouridine synthase DusB [Pseudomonadota bacterium]
MSLVEKQANSPKVFLAPLAGITDLPFRNLVLEFGADRVVSEMVATYDAVQQRPSAQARRALGIGSARTAIQIAGKDAPLMAKAAAICESSGAEIIDINMGCPAKKVTNGYAGSALMRDLQGAKGIISAVRAAVSVPVTLKMRLGWDADSLNAPELARIAEGEGVSLVTVHGRTRSQFYKGHADWSQIGLVKRAVAIPVIANGDITDIAAAQQALRQSNADGIMIGRGAQGRPWLLDQVRCALKGRPPNPAPMGWARLALVKRHYNAIVGFYDEPIGTRMARKHLSWYMDALPTPKVLRHAILTETVPSRVLELIDNLPWQAARVAA